MNVDTVTFARLEAAGRLGNQLWQVAAAAGLARRAGARVSVPQRWSYRPWLCLPADWYRAPSGRKCEAWQLDEQLAHIHPAARLYLQDAGLLDGVEREVAAAFAPSPRARQMIDSTVRVDEYRDDVAAGAIVMHVRRGDLLTQTPGHQPVLSVDYYRAALATFDDVDVVWLFSDEPDVEQLVALADLLELDAHVKVMRSTPARSHQLNMYRREQALDWVDLQLMAEAHRHVIANSTYAWWAAWLSPDPSPRYPQAWHGPERAHIDASLMFPQHWQMVPC